jgi:hypothetical protein
MGSRHQLSNLMGGATSPRGRCRWYSTGMGTGDSPRRWNYARPRSRSKPTSPGRVCCRFSSPVPWHLWSRMTRHPARLNLGPPSSHPTPTSDSPTSVLLYCTNFPFSPRRWRRHYDGRIYRYRQSSSGWNEYREYGRHGNVIGDEYPDPPPPTTAEPTTTSPW